jgi:uncharacterized protein
MNRIYVDTSVWVAAYGAEASGAKTLEWLHSSNLHTVVTSDWITTEFASAIAMKKRRGELSVTDGEHAHLDFEIINQQLLHLSIDSVDYVKAASLCRDANSNLRASDALHLALAIRHKCTDILSLDHVLNAQAKRQGIRVIDL